MKKSLRELGIMALLALWISHSPLQAATISIACSALGQELELCRTGADTWAKETGHTVNIVSTPNSSTERLALYQQLLAAGAADVDVFLIDVIWPGILSSQLIDLTPYADGTEQAHFQAIIGNNTVDGRLVAMPWFIDAGLLYYRKDLLDKYGEPVPETWAQLTATAKKIQTAERAAGNDKLWGFVWQGRAYEGLTCNALEWVVSHDGGTIVDAEGKVTINNPQAIAALTQAAGWMKTISPEGVLNYAEEEARGVFQAGNAVFMRNWPYAWALARSPDSAVKGKVGVAALPKGGAAGRYAATLGGGQLAVSKYSNHPAIAADLVLYLTGAAEQKRRAIEGSFNPTRKALYQDPEILAANPFFGDLYDTFVNAVPRPSTVTGAKYNPLSSEFWNAVHSVLSGQLSASTSLARLENRLKRLSRGGRRW
ncbi:MAG: ABC transporter substrate-binding protein [Candidatus Competibacteraceae bacterium]|jgi:trehalose/maltose transport system substrate-binding protein|nr:ABC transporter substrate-binding protein [Candidatus Competibacteraceae bacterium]